VISGHLVLGTFAEHHVGRSKWQGRAVHLMADRKERALLFFFFFNYLILLFVVGDGTQGLLCNSFSTELYSQPLLNVSFFFSSFYFLWRYWHLNYGPQAC
jgi:hypothetical protein